MVVSSKPWLVLLGTLHGTRKHGIHQTGKFPENYGPGVPAECRDMLVLWRVSLFFNFQMAQNHEFGYVPLRL